MSQWTRRDFMGAMAGLTAAPLVLGTGCGDRREEVEPAKTGTAPGAGPRGSSALEVIQATLDRWRREGHQFDGDPLPPQADDQWSRLIDFYFPHCDAGPIPLAISVNAANLCPSLRYVDEMVTLVQQMLDCDISFPLRGELATASQSLAGAAIQSWTGMPSGTPESVVALTRNTTEGNNVVNNGLVSGFFDPEQHNVVVWDQNHPTNYEAWEYRAATKGWPPDAVRPVRTRLFEQEPTDSHPLPSDPQDADVALKAIHGAIDDRTRVVSLSWQSNECGMVLPMARIVEAIRAQYRDQIHVHADCAQTFGVLDLSLEKIGVDSMAGSFHKWPCGPKMVGALYLRGEAAERFLPSLWGYDEYIKTPIDYGFEPSQIDPDSKRFAYLGQQNDATLVATLVTALFHTGELHPHVTPAKIQERVHYLGGRTQAALYRALPEIFPDFMREPYRYIATPTTLEELRSSVFLFKVPDGISPGDVMLNVYREHGYAIAALEGLLRISPTFNNTPDQIEGAVDAVIDVIQAMQEGKLPNQKHLRRYS